MTTLLELRTMAKEFSDQNNSNFITNDKWDIFLNNAQKSAYNNLIKLHEDYFLTDVVTLFINGTKEYTLPTDFWKIRGVDYIPGGDLNQSQTMREFGFEQRNMIGNAGIVSVTNASNGLKYRVMATTLRFEPNPATATDSFRLWYIQKPPKMTADASVSVIPDLFDEYQATHAAYQGARKQEVEVAKDLKEDLLRLREEMQSSAGMRRADVAKTIAIVEDDYDGNFDDQLFAGPSSF